MKKPLILAVSALFVLIGAAYPEVPKLAYSADALESVDPTPSPVRYRPCRRSASDDRCIQLYERGVRTAYAQWLRAKDDEPGHRTRLAQGGPYEPRAHRVMRRHARNDRCNDVADAHPSHAAPAAHHAPAPEPAPETEADGGEVRGM